MKFGYARVSTNEQNEARQVEELIHQGIEQKNIFIDKTSGKDFNRKNYEILKIKLRAGDEVYFHELDRIGRDKDIIKKELEWFKSNKITFRILDIPTTLVDISMFGELQYSILDMLNNLLIEVLTTLSEAEYKKIKKRQKEGIENAKVSGKYKKCGRPSVVKPDNWDYLYDQYKKGNITMENLQQVLGDVSRSTVYNLIKKYSYKSFDKN